MNVYQENGFECRWDYLEFLADKYDVTLDTVSKLAEELGESEDFNGLVDLLEENIFFE